MATASPDQRRLEFDALYGCNDQGRLKSETPVQTQIRRYEHMKFRRQDQLNEWIYQRRGRNALCVRTPIRAQL